MVRSGRPKKTCPWLPFKGTKKRQKTPHKNHQYVLKIFIPRNGIPYQNCHPCDYKVTSEERTAAMIYNQNAVTLPKIHKKLCF
jgi:hypothetical protein